MSYLLNEILVYIIAAAGIGVAVGWFIRHRLCNAAVDEMQVRLNRSKSAFDNQAKMVSSYKKLHRNLTAELENQSGELKLMTSRWQTTLAKAKELSKIQSWLKNVQGMYQATCTERNRFSNLANQNAAMHADAVQKIKRLNERVTNQEALSENEMHGLTQLRSVNDDVITKVRRLNTKVTNSENDIRGLYGMVAQVQSKWRHDRVDTVRLRELNPKMEEQKNQAQWRLAELDKKYTEQFEEQKISHIDNIDTMQKRIDELTPLEGEQVGQNSKFNRFMDKIRLVGTSKNTVLGRTYNQIEEVKLEASQKERVFVDTCEEKDAIIDDLREQVRTAENRTQATCSVQILESNTKIHSLESEINSLNKNADILREHEHTIEALKSKNEAQNNNNAGILREHEHTIEALKNKLGIVSEPSTGKKTSEKPAKTSKSETEFKAPAKGLKIAAAKVRDELQVIKGIGPKMEKTLNDFGVYSFEQLANLISDDITALADKLGGFPGRMERDKWVSQSIKHFKKKYE